MPLDDELILHLKNRYEEMVGNVDINLFILTAIIDINESINSIEKEINAIKQREEQNYGKINRN